jgi:hypothetical protein
MKFHPEKCNVPTISKKRSPSKYNYTLHGHILEHDTSAKYLGCTISSDLKWGKHISIDGYHFVGMGRILQGRSYKGHVRFFFNRFVGDVYVPFKKTDGVVGFRADGAYMFTHEENIVDY